MCSEDLHISTSKVTYKLKRLRITTVEGQLGTCDRKTPSFPRWVSIVRTYCVQVDHTLFYTLLTLTMSVLQRLAFEAIGSFY